MDLDYGNLGDYARITAQAKEAGGVENLISDIANDAIQDAAPRQIGAGIAIGAATVAAVMYVRKIPAVKAKLDQTARAAAEAKEKIRKIVANASGRDETSTGDAGSL